MSIVCPELMRVKLHDNLIPFGRTSLSLHVWTFLDFSRLPEPVFLFRFRLIYTVSGVQKSDSVIHTCTYIYKYIHVYIYSDSFLLYFITKY